MLRPSPSKISLAVLMAISSFSAVAAEDTILSETEVTAPKLVIPTKQANETVYTGTAITAEGIERQGRKAESSVYGAIDMLPGVNTENPDASGLSVEQSAVRVRGVRSILGALSVEGVPNYGVSALGPRDYLYDMQNFTDVSVYKGATPGDLGSGVGDRGGAIVLRPKWSGEKFAGVLSQTIGSDSHTRTYMRLESGILGTAGTRISAAASYAKGDKWRGYGDLGPRTNVNLTLSQPLGENFDLKLWYNHNQQDQHLYKSLTHKETLDLNANYKNDYGNDPTKSDYYGYNRAEYRNDDIMGVLTWRANPSTTVTVKPYYSKEDTHRYTTQYNPKGDPVGVQRFNRDIKRKGVIAEVAADFSGIKGVLGYHYETADMDYSVKNYKVTGGSLNFDGGTPAGAPTTVHSPYFKLSGKFDKLSWQAGLKYFSFKEGATAGYLLPASGVLKEESLLNLKARTYKVWLPSLGLAYDLTPQTQLQASAGRNFIRPYAYLPLVSSYKGNMAAFKAALSGAGIPLQSLFDGYGMEKSDTIDLSLRHQAEHFDITPTLFYSKHKNLLTAISDSRVIVGGSPVSYQQNVGKATSYGMELAFNAYVNDRLSFFVNPTYNHFTYDKDIEFKGARQAVKGKQVVDTPRWMARAGLNYRWGDFEISPSVRYLGKRYGTATHTEQIGSHVVADLGIRYTRKKVLGNATLKAGLELNNLFNRKYVSVINGFDDNVNGSSYMVGAPFSAALKVGLEW